MEAGRSTNKGGRLYFDMATMLMVFLTYEAYLNFLGNHVAPEIWRNERIYFSKPPYVGVNGKLKKILEVCGNINVDKGKRPYQTIQELRKLRDFLSHGKPIKFGKTISHHVDHDPPLFDTGLSKYITPRKAERAIKDTEQFIESLYKDARLYAKRMYKGNLSRTWDIIFYGDKALNGPIEYSSAHSL